LILLREAYEKVPTTKMPGASDAPSSGSSSLAAAASSLAASAASRVKTHANPIRLVLFSPICQYCRKPASHYADCYYQCAAIACKDEQHIAWADRDANHWLHILKKVRFRDYTTHKLFTETGLLEKPITVKRSSGAVDDDWNILKYSFGHDALILKDSDKGWCIPVINYKEDIHKHIHVEDLKDSLPDEQKGLVDEFIDSLNEGFYLKDAEAHDLASANAEAEEEESSPIPVGYGIEDVFHPEYGAGRVVRHH
jgi:hypothetical protein